MKIKKNLLAIVVKRGISELLVTHWLNRCDFHSKHLFLSPQ